MATSTPYHPVVLALDTALEQIDKLDDLGELTERDLTALIGKALELVDLTFAEIDLRDRTLAIQLVPMPTPEPDPPLSG